MPLFALLGNEFTNILDLAVKRGAKLIYRFGFYVVVSLQAAHRLAIYSTFLTELVGRNALFLHRFPKPIKNYHFITPFLTFYIMGVIIYFIKGI